MARLQRPHARALAAARRLAADGKTTKACAQLRKAAASDDADPAFLRAACRFLDDHGDGPGALDAVERCLEKRPFDPAALRLRCLLAILCRQDAAAAERDLAALQALRAAPEAFRTIAAAGLLGLRGRTATARADLALLLARDPRNADALRMDLLCALQAGDTTQALARIERLRRDWPDCPVGLGAVMQSCADQTERPQPKRDALPWMTAPDDPAVMRAQLAGISARRPDWERPVASLGLLELKQGNPQAALDAIMAARAHVPDHKLPLTVWTRALLALGRIAEAGALAEQTHLAGQGGWRPYYMRARVAAARGDRATEAAALREGLNRYPQNANLLKRLLRSCLGQQIPPEDMAGWQHMFRARDHRHMALIEIEACLKHCDFDQALILLRALRRNPRAALGAALRVRWIARALDGQNRDRVALRYLRRVLPHWPTDKRLPDEYLRILLRRDRARTGLRFLRRTGYASQHGPVAAAEQKLGLYLRAGRLEAALKALGVLEAADRIPWARLPLLLRAALAEGDGAAAARLAALIERDPRSTAQQTQQTLHGQFLSEYRLLAFHDAQTTGSGPAARSAHAMSPIDTTAPDALEQLARLMTAMPASNIAATRLLRHWARLHASARQGAAGFPGGERAKAPIPAQILQYWDSPAPPPEIRRMVESWQHLPGHGHQLLDRRMALERLRRDFRPDWVQAFLRAAKVAEESDFLRLCLLARDGGIYADTDDSVTDRPGTLARMIHCGAGLVVYLEPVGAGLGNNFIAAAAKHPAIVLAALQARRALLSGASESTWSKTGPGLLSRAVALYIAREVLAGRRPDVAVLPRARLLRHVTFHNRLPYKATPAHWKSRARLGESAALSLLLRDLLAPRKAA